MRECPTCLKCFDDSVSECPDDGRPTFNSLPGEVVLDGRYVLERRLGEGGMGVVYKAHHKFLKTTRAIKVIKPELVGNDPSFATRFQQEAMAAAAIGHPNIISVPDYGFIGGSIPFLVMEFIEGCSLQDLMSEEGRLSPERALEYMRVIASGVGAAHHHGIVHRDLKPLNIMIHLKGTPREQIRILDFGLAKIKSGDLFGSFVGAKTTGIIGSPYYMAPEQWSDEEPDKRCDIYSLGIILYQMLTGDVPFKGTSIPSVMKKHLMTAPPPLTDTSGISEELERVVLHALEKDPGLRTGSAEQLIEELEAALLAAGPSVAKGRARGRPRKTKTPTTRSRVSTAARTTAEQATPQPEEEVVARSTADQQEALKISQPTELSPHSDGTLVVRDQGSSERKGTTSSPNVPRDSGSINPEADTLIRGGSSGRNLVAQPPELEEALDNVKEADPKAVEVDSLRRAAEEARRRATERALREAGDSRDVSLQARSNSTPPGTPSIPKISLAPALSNAQPGLLDQSGTFPSLFKKPLILGIAAALLLGVVGLVALISFWPSSDPAQSNEQAGKVPTLSRDMAFIKGGTFNMGSNAGFPEQKPTHAESVDSFYIDKREVTNDDYATFVKATGHPVPTIDTSDPDAQGGYWKPWIGTDPPAGWGHWPVCNVTVKDAEAFAKWLSQRDGVEYRLPTEKEWEFAARNGSTGSLFPWGNSWVDGRAHLNEAHSPRDVGSHPDGATQSGLLDMIGNVWEWTSTKASYYDKNPKKVDTNSANANVYRGGSFAEKAADDSFYNATDRSWLTNDKMKFPTIGFRLARNGQ